MIEIRFNKYGATNHRDLQLKICRLNSAIDLTYKIEIIALIQRFRKRP